MATEGQQRLLFTVARDAGLTLPEWDQTRGLTSTEVDEALTAIKSGVDVFASTAMRPTEVIEVSSPNFAPSVVRLFEGEDGARIEVRHHGDRGQSETRVFHVVPAARDDLAEAFEAAADLLRGAA